MFPFLAVAVGVLSALLIDIRVRGVLLSCVVAAFIALTIFYIPIILVLIGLSIALRSFIPLVVAGLMIQIGVIRYAMRFHIEDFDADIR